VGDPARRSHEPRREQAERNDDEPGHRERERGVTQDAEGGEQRCRPCPDAEHEVDECVVTTAKATCKLGIAATGL